MADLIEFQPAKSGAPNEATLCSPTWLSDYTTSMSENGLPILRKPLATEHRADLQTRIRTISEALADGVTERLAILTVGKLQSMPRRPDDVVSGKILGEVWIATLTDTEMTGVIPPWAVERATREYLAGKHGRWMPSPGDFIGVCKEIMQPAQQAAWRFRRLLDAKVEVAPVLTDAEREARAERVRALMATLETKTETVE